MSVQIINADVMDGLARLADESVHCVVTSPPYWGLRDYGVEGQIGLEPTPEAFVAKMVEVFREVRRVLRDDGTLWLNLGDSYCNTDKWGGGGPGTNGKQTVAPDGTVPSWAVRRKRDHIEGIKPKDLVGIPWMVAFALRADGWWLRQEIIWHKPNPMPESVQDRCTKAHEHIFLLTKSERYWYDAGAIKEAAAPETAQRYASGYEDWGKAQFLGSPIDKRGPKQLTPEMLVGKGEARNKRSVWTIATQPFPEAHFATFPEELPETCIKAGCPAGGTVLDPFGGAGTTGLVADKLGRDAILIEINAEYCAIAERRIHGDCPMFADVRVS